MKPMARRVVPSATAPPTRKGSKGDRPSCAGTPSGVTRVVQEGSALLRETFRQKSSSGGRTVEIACDLDIEKTPESLHAHAIPDGIEIRPGDVVIVHGAPADVAFGERVRCRCRATVTRAGPLARLWTEAVSLFELTELYEVGFQPKEIP